MSKRMIGVALTMVALAGWLVGSAGGGSAVATADYERATSFNHQGYSLHCTATPCPIPLLTGMPFNFQRLGATYDAVVTISFTYETSVGLRASFTPGLSPNDFGVSPQALTRYLSPAPKSRSVSLTWVFPSLTGGQEYSLVPGIGPAGTPSSYDVSITDITMVVEGAPA